MTILVHNCGLLGLGRFNRDDLSVYGLFLRSKNRSNSVLNEIFPPVLSLFPEDESTSKLLR